MEEVSPKALVTTYAGKVNMLRKQIFNQLMNVTMDVPITCDHFRVCFYASSGILIEMHHIMKRVVQTRSVKR